MRDDRRPRFDEEDNLFSELRAELDAVDRADAAAPANLGPKLPPDTPPSDRPGAPAVAAYPPEGFDSDEALDRLPSLPPRAGRPRFAPPRAPGRRPSRLILGAVCLAVVGAVFLFWRPGGKSEAPLGLGERTSTVTRGGARPPADPVTGTVDIAAETSPLVPEQGAANADVGTPALRAPTVPTPSGKQLTIRAPQLNPQTGPVRPVVQPNVGTPASRAMTSAASGTSPPLPSGTARATGSEPPRSFAQEPATSPASTADLEPAPATTTVPETPPVAAAAPPAAGVQPTASGVWSLQLGAFSTQENAAALAAKLRGQGLKPFVQTGSSARGALVFKVAIGYFATREEAATYAKRNAGILGTQALPTHR